MNNDLVLKKYSVGFFTASLRSLLTSTVFSVLGIFCPAGRSKGSKLQFSSPKLQNPHSDTHIHADSKAYIIKELLFIFQQSSVIISDHKHLRTPLTLCTDTQKKSLGQQDQLT